MTLAWEQVIVHSQDPAALGQWWAEALEGNELCILSQPGQ